MTGAWLRDGVRGTWLRFGPARGTIVATTPSEVLPALRAIEAEVERQGVWAVGWIGYEAAPGFDAALTVRGGPANGIAAASTASLPLVHFSLHDAPDVVAALPSASDDAAFTAPARWSPTITIHLGNG